MSSSWWIKKTVMMNKMISKLVNCSSRQFFLMDCIDCCNHLLLVWLQMKFIKRSRKLPKFDLDSSVQKNLMISHGWIRFTTKQLYWEIYARVSVFSWLMKKSESTSSVIQSIVSLLTIMNNKSKMLSRINKTRRKKELHLQFQILKKRIYSVSTNIFHSNQETSLKCSQLSRS